MTEPFKHAGSVSHGTMRNEDLLPTFLLILEDLDRDSFLQVTSGDAEDDERVVACLMIDGSTVLPDALQGSATELVVWIMDRLDDAAPDGFYFGTTDGDGSDYGFWAVDAEGDE